MSFVTVALFFLICWLFGFSLTSFVKNSSNFFERHIMRIGFGIAAFPLVALVLNLVGIRADWRILLGISAIYPIYYVVRRRPKITLPRLTVSSIFAVIVIGLCIAKLTIFTQGAFSYPYLENDDSWSHAIGVSYMAHGANAYSSMTDHVGYINPYPPSYDIIIGVMHQTNPSVSWTLKYFNSLLISLSLLFFYFFVKEFMGNKTVALFATIMLFAIPSFLSHFIWALVLAVLLYFVSFYATEKIKEDKKWIYVAAVSIATTLLSSPSHSAYFGFLFVIYLGLKVLHDRTALAREGLAGLIGLVASFAIWWVPLFLRKGIKGIYGFDSERIMGSFGGIGGTGDTVYSLHDFVFGRMGNAINNPIGIGVVICILVALSLLFIWLIFRKHIMSHRFIILPSFVGSLTLMTAFLYAMYVKDPWLIKDSLFVFNIPFSVFWSSQSWFVLIMGIFLFFLLSTFICAIVFREGREHLPLIILLAWLLFCFYAVNAAPYTYRLSPFRVWLVLAIPVCILAAFAARKIMVFCRSLGGQAGMIIFIVLLLFGLYHTSFVFMKAVNTTQWHPGGFWASNEQIGSYIWIKENFAPQTRMFTYQNPSLLIGMDMYTCAWCKDEDTFRKTHFDMGAQETYDWLRDRSYKYLIIDAQTARNQGANETNEKIVSLTGTGRFRPVLSNPGLTLLEII